MDALVAEHVMGWTSHDGAWLARGGMAVTLPPNYSTSDAAAMLVIEHMRPFGKWEISTSKTWGYMVRFIHHGEPGKPYVHSQLQVSLSFAHAVAMAAIEAAGQRNALTGNV